MGKHTKWVTPVSVVVDGKKVVKREYNQWAGMKIRAGTHKFYEGVSLSDKFKSYDSWCEWAKKQKGFMNVEPSGKVWAIDKDILGDGKLYSEDVCVFVPVEINNLIKSSGNKGLPTGVWYDSGVSYHNYKAIGGYLGHQFQLGGFSDVKRAHFVYLQFRTWMVEDIILRYGNSVDERVYQSLRASCDINNYHYG